MKGLNTADIDARIRMQDETSHLLARLSQLPQVARLKVKGMEICAGAFESMLQEIVDRSFHDRFSDVDIVLDLRLHPEDYRQHGATLGTRIGCRGRASRSWASVAARGRRTRKPCGFACAPACGST